MANFLKIIWVLFLFVFLTAVTQIGGIVYLLSLVISRRWTSRYRVFFSFIGLYLVTTLLIVPLIAPVFGREKVRHIDGIQPTTYMTVLLNRNYVRPKLNDLLAKTRKDLDGTGVEIRYLDANFPFINKFPLLPHLSHHDGKKIDLSMIYETKNGAITDSQKSRSGYGVFEDPTPKEYNQIDQCYEKGYFQYEYSKYFTFGTINTDLIFSEKATRILVRSVLKNKDLGKLFIEPHLKNRLGLEDERVRYQGCRSVRHDDHIHIQLR